jgi:hypothetical protein
LNGSISSPSVIQPSLGLVSGGVALAPKVSQGAAETSSWYRLARFG